jgi:ribosomal protein S18 acetylase RimI-like enzyme
MPISLPVGFTLRASSTSDLQEITELVRACELADTGRSETLPADIEDGWENMTPATDTFVVLAPTGQIAGYTGVASGPEMFLLDIHTGVHPLYRHYHLDHVVFALAEERARQQLIEASSSLLPSLRGWAFTARQRQLLLQAGFVVTTSELNLEILLDEQPVNPTPIPGISFRLYTPGQDERAIHAVIQHAFQDIGGHPYQPFEDWTEGVMGHAYFDPQVLFVAMDGENMVGATVCRTYEYANEGHITQLGIEQSWRKRGIARHLLQLVFSAYYQRPIHRITISVDEHNTTGARQLYDAMGMRQYEQVDTMQKSLE